MNTEQTVGCGHSTLDRLQSVTAPQSVVSSSAVCAGDCILPPASTRRTEEIFRYSDVSDAAEARHVSNDDD